VSFSLLSGFGQITLFLLMILVVVGIHEWGHFLVARWNGVRVETFAIGMGPSLLRWTSLRSGTTYAINAFPLGGYCRLKEACACESVCTCGQSDFMLAKSPLQRLSVFCAGPAMNFVLAWVLFAIMIVAVGGSHSTSTIRSVLAGKPAALAGLLAGDRITAVNGVSVFDGADIRTQENASHNGKLLIDYVRDGRPGRVEIKAVGLIGIRETSTVYTPLSISEAFAKTWASFSAVCSVEFDAVHNLVTRPSAVASQGEGVIGMARDAGEYQAYGPIAYLGMAAMISTSLGMFNLLPFPALDGGRAVFAIIEMVFRRAVPRSVEAYVHAGGMLSLLVLMLAANVHDILKMVAR
jgi:regulator of sigma E protease